MSIKSRNEELQPGSAHTEQEPSKGMFGGEVTLTDLVLIKQGTVEGFFKDRGHSNSHFPHTAFQQESPAREKVKLQRELESTGTHSCYD